MSISSRSKSASPEPIDSSPLHLKVYYSTRPARFPSVDTLPHPTDPYISLFILPSTTLRTITLLLAPQLNQQLLSPPTSDPHPSDIIGARLFFCLIYPISTTSTNPRAPPKYEIKSLGTITIGDAEDHISSQQLSGCGFVTGDLLYLAIIRDGETVPPIPTFAHDRPLYSAPRGDRRREGGGLEQEQWARGGGFGSGGGRGGGRDRDRRGSRNLREAGWSRGEEVPEGGGGREDWTHGSRGRGGGIGWARGGRGGDRW